MAKKKKAAPKVPRTRKKSAASTAKTAKKVAKTAKAKATRKSGRPHGNRVIPPIEYENISKLYLTGVSAFLIAQRYKVHKKTIESVLKRFIIPAFQASLGADRGTHLEMLKLLYAECWNKFYADAACETQEQIKEAFVESADGVPLGMNVVERIVRKFKRPQDRNWMQTALAVLQEVAKIRGHYAAAKHEIDVGLRIAGETASEVDERMINLLFDKIEQRRDFEDNLRKAGHLTPHRN